MLGDGGQRRFALVQLAINSLMSQMEKQFAFFGRILAGRGQRVRVRRAGKLTELRLLDIIAWRLGADQG